MSTFDKGVLRGKLEIIPGLDPGVGSADGLEAIAPQFDPDFTSSPRDVVEGHLSPKPITVRRRLANLQFQLEIKGSGVPGSAGKLGSLLQACWMAPAQVSGGLGQANSLYDMPIWWGAHTGDFTFTKTGTYGGSVPRRYHAICTVPGGSGTAAFFVRSPSVLNGLGLNASVATTLLMTNALSFPLVHGAAITPTITNDFVVGDTFIIWCIPNGWVFTPQQSNASPTNTSMTFHYYVDGALHVITGARGTVSASGTAGEIGLFTFNFIGNYNDATGAAIPATTQFEATEPPQIESANLWFPKFFDASPTLIGTQDSQACASQFTFDLANTVVPEECVNAIEGNLGARISSRAPTFSADPEFLNEDGHGFFGGFETGAKWDIGAVVGGGVANNAVAFICPQLQTDAQPYSDREGKRVLDINAVASRLDPNNGNDEMVFWVG